MTISATMEQDKAAGGLERRKMRIRSGEIVVVSLAIGPKSAGGRRGVTMRFKSGGLTVGRLVGRLEEAGRGELLKSGWEKVREEKLAEQNQWSWLVE